MEAEILVAKLEQEGIKAMVISGSAGGMLPSLPNPYNLYVFAADTEAAIEILNQHEIGEDNTFHDATMEDIQYDKKLHEIEKFGIPQAWVILILLLLAGFIFKVLHFF